MTEQQQLSRLLGEIKTVALSLEFNLTWLATQSERVAALSEVVNQRVQGWQEATGQHPDVQTLHLSTLLNDLLAEAFPWAETQQKLAYLLKLIEEAGAEA